MASWAFRMTNLVERNLDGFTHLNRTYYKTCTAFTVYWFLKVLESCKSVAATVIY